VLVVDTSAPRTLAGSAYNERFAQCQQAAKTFGVASLRDVSPEEFERRRGELSDVVAQRVEHVIYESPRTLDAVQAMKAGDLVRLGQLMNQSHDSLRDLYAVSSFELDTVVNITRAIPGVYGARMTGAGFGGCAIALVRNDAVEAARAAVLADYPRLTNREPKVYVCVASEGASWRTI
jgi:galactokinase